MSGDVQGGRSMGTAQGRVWLVGCLVAALAFIGWNVYVVIDRERTTRKSALCVSHLKTLAAAALEYSAQHDGRLPPAEGWCDLLVPYVRDRSAFVCPETRNQTCSYALNEAIAGLRVTDLEDASATVILFESDAGWNAAGGSDLIPLSPRHFGGDILGYADGHPSWRHRRCLRVGHEEHWLREYVTKSRPDEWSPHIDARE